MAVSHTLPPLQNGDRLDRFEFERRYNAMPHLKKAELVSRTHGSSSPHRTTRRTPQPHRNVTGCLRTIEKF